MSRGARKPTRKPTPTPRPTPRKAAPLEATPRKAAPLDGERRTPHDRRSGDDRRELPPRPEGRRLRGRRCSDPVDA